VHFANFVDVTLFRVGSVLNYPEKGGEVDGLDVTFQRLIRLAFSNLFQPFLVKWVSLKANFFMACDRGHKSCVQIRRYFDVGVWKMKPVN
jgi:hypothetical protein